MKKLIFRPSLCFGIPATFKRLPGRMVALPVIILLMAGLGCGGGTSGSGVKSFEGKISRRNGASVPNAQISIESTGESSISDSNGNFALQSSVPGDSVDFTIEAESASQRFSVDGLSDEDVRVALDIVLEGPGIAPAVHNLSMRAWFVGLCEPFFDNGDVIRQQALVPRGAICSLNVELLGDGERLSSVPLVLEYSSCDESQEWTPIAFAQTGSGRSAGAAEINFEFKNTPEFCRYRVVLEQVIGKFPFVTYPIDTLTEQEIQGVRSHK